MCRNIKTLFNFEPPATEAEIRAACEQFVRKVSGTSKPSKHNQQVMQAATADISERVKSLLDALVTQAKPKNRQAEAAKARARSAERFMSTST